MTEGIHTIREKSPWSLIYGPEFKNIHETHPNIISKIENLLATENTHDGDISIELIHTKLHKKYYKLTISGEKYFLKEITHMQNISAEGGMHEYKDAQEATELLANIPGVKVVSYVFGFSNDSKKYSVTKWDTSAEKSLARILDDIENEPNNPTLDEISFKKESILSRVKHIQNILSDFKDITPLNMGYDIKTDTIILFDVNKGNGSGLQESSDDEL